MWTPGEQEPLEPDRRSAVMTTALLLIDWQQAFRDLAFWGRRNNLGAEANAAALVGAWRGRGAPILHVQHHSREAGSPLAADGAGAAPEPFAEPQVGEPVHIKQVNSGFIGTALEADLRQRGITSLIVTGVSTDHCVSTTVRMAANLGFAVTLAGDACFTFDRRTPGGDVLAAEAVHEANLASLHGEFATVRSTAAILAS